MYRLVQETRHYLTQLLILKHFCLIDLLLFSRLNESKISLLCWFLSDVLKELLQAFPALAMTTNSINATALDTAATQGHIDIVNLLLQMDASLARFAKNNGQTALHSAVRMGHVEVVTSLLNVDPALCLRTDKKGQTALHIALKGENVEIVIKLLMYNSTGIHIEDNNGNTPFHVATRKGNATVSDCISENLLYSELSTFPDLHCQ